MKRRDEIETHLREVQERIRASAQAAGRSSEDITLIVVTKNFPTSDVELLKELGINDFGENRDGEAAPKACAISGTWHFQGQIQSNKLKSICSWAQVIHSLDDARHWEIIERIATHPLQIFLQVNLDRDTSRGGVNLDSLYPIARAVEKSTSHSLAGLMAIAPLGTEAEIAFTQLAAIQIDFLKEFPKARALSAGMSGDYEIAIAYGATHLRIGSSILGSRRADGYL